MWKKLSENSGEILFHNCNVVLSESVEKQDVLVVDGKIKEVGKNINPSSNAEKIDCEGNYLAPGIIDPFVHIGEPAGQYKESLYNTAQSAIAGGITTIGILPDTKPVIDSTSMVEYIKNCVVEKSQWNVSVFGAVIK